MRMEPHEYTLDGTVFRGELAWDESRPGPRPGVFIAHEGGGFNDHSLRRARLLAEEGYVALAGDMYGERRQTKSREEAMALIGELRADLGKLRARVNAGVEALRRAPGVDARRIAAIGFCFGGLTVLELARSGADVAGVVSFHGLLATSQPARPGEVKARVLACHGHNDPLVPPEQLVAFMRELEAAGADWQVLALGGAAHGFMNRDAKNTVPGIVYDERAERRGWAALQRFFGEIFG
jgi:dienelactone hydrolase